MSKLWEELLDLAAFVIAVAVYGVFLYGVSAHSWQEVLR